MQLNLGKREVSTHLHSYDNWEEITKRDNVERFCVSKVINTKFEKHTFLININIQNVINVIIKRERI